MVPFLVRQYSMDEKTDKQGNAISRESWDMTEKWTEADYDRILVEVEEEDSTDVQNLDNIENLFNGPEEESDGEEVDGDDDGEQFVEGVNFGV